MSSRPVQPGPFSGKRPPAALFALAAGLCWLWVGARAGPLAFLLAAAPGTLLLGYTSAAWLHPGEQRAAHYGALGALAGVLAALVGPAAVGFGPALGLAGLCAAAFVAVGWGSVQQQPPITSVPHPEPTARVAFAAAIDEALVGMLKLALRMPSGRAAEHMAAEVEETIAFYEARGWREKPLSAHAAPLPLDSPELAASSFFGVAYERMCFESEYEPYADEPGRERWLGYRANRTARAWVVRHADAGRPWLVCIHGYRMGWPLADLGLFDPRVFHRKLGLNLLVPVLPLHGKRGHSWRSGDGFMDRHPVDTLHAELQAIWDMRRMLSWVRDQGGERIGVYGVSLGGFNAALLASVEPDLECVVAGVPVSDFTRLFWHHGPELTLREYEDLGAAQARFERLFAPIAPLGLEPRLPRERRAVFGGIADRVVPPEQVRDLMQHWQPARAAWYPGGHTTFLREPSVRAALGETLRDAGLTA